MLRPAEMSSPTRRWAITGASLAAIVAALPHFWGCVKDHGGAASYPASAFHDDFERTELGSNWNATSPVWHIVDGHLTGAMAHNHGCWLVPRIPRDCRVEFDAWSNDPAGDLKAELFGDGRSYATSVEYTSTGYVVIFGGWHNQLDVVARMEEHGADRLARPTSHVNLGQHYHFAVTRRDKTLQWVLDGQPHIDYHDDDPLAGPGHDHFGFNDWEAEVNFDNVSVTPL